jgi:hypothetical protein
MTYARSLDTSRWKDSGSAEAKTEATFFGIPLKEAVLFVVDASGSMNNGFGGITRFQAVIKELIGAIDSLEPNQAFNVALFDGGIHWTDGSWTLQEGTQENIDSMIAVLKTMNTDRGTNYEAALNLPMMYTPRPAQVIFLSDGAPTGGYDYSDEVQALANNGIRVDCVGIALDSSTLSNLEAIAGATGGTVADIQP